MTAPWRYACVNVNAKTNTGKVGTTEPLINAQIIRDYTPADTSPRRHYVDNSAPSRSAPIGIPGKLMR